MDASIRILLLLEEKSWLALIEHELKQLTPHVKVLSTLDEPHLRKAWNTHAPTVVLLGLKNAPENHSSLFSFLSDQDPCPPVILLTEHTDTPEFRELIEIPVILNYIVLDRPERLAFNVPMEHQRFMEEQRRKEETAFTKTLHEIAVKGANVGLWQLDLKTFETHFNNIWYEMLGFTAKDVQFNKGFFDSILHPDDRPVIEGHMRNIMEGKSTGFDVTIRMMDTSGDYHWILDRATVVGYNQDGSPSSLAGSHVDITERMRIEEDLQNANNTLRSLIEASPVAIYQIDPKGVVIDFWNAAAENIFGYHRDEVLNSVMPQIQKENRAEMREFLKQIRQGKKLVQKRLERVNAKGEPIIIEVNTGPLFNEKGQLQSILVISSDVTDLVMHERELEASVYEKNILIQEIHHRVKNNLAIITGLLELQTQTPETRPIIQTTVARIKTIAFVHELLYNTDSFTEINLEQYCDLLMGNMMKTHVDGENLKVACDIKVETLSINTAIPLGLLINELFLNSVKYAFKNIPDPGIFISLSRKDDLYFFSYEDNGVGIEEPLLEESEGFGFKLIRTLLSQLNADYTIESTDGFHLRFTFDARFKGSHGNPT